ncbi:amidohydrolase family protein [Streptomyces albiaxialis]|uniref:Amidohydrolase family protein n=1 Tax=Streptomyces albiaxialis TaxID=329523 RepID=A0ABN2W4V8_9ACTN
MAGFPSVPLVDQHGYGVLHTDLGLATFETHLAAAEGGVPPGHGSFYDSGPGLAVRRWCPPLLGLEPHCPPALYLARRRELGAFAVARALLRGSGIRCFLVSGATEGTYGPEAHGLTSPGELAAASGGRAREAVCLESLAAQVADTSGSVRAFVTNTAEALHTAARGAAAFTCAAAFHEGEPPGPGEVLRAAGRRLRRRAAAAAALPPRRIPGRVPPEEPVLVRHLVWGALATGRPVQLRCGDPAPLEGFLRASEGRGAEVVLLARRPYHRAAARLAAVFPHVHADVGPRPAETLAEAPFAKLLFSTGARALPELYVVRARAFTGALGRLLAEWVAEGVCAPGDASRIAARVGSGNASRLYRLGVGEGEGAAAC